MTGCVLRGIVLASLAAIFDSFTLPATAIAAKLSSASPRMRSTDASCRCWPSAWADPTHGQTPEEFARMAAGRLDAAYSDVPNEATVAY